ncbi:MAG: hypothetical protein ACRECQ_09775, partial [Burkholderiaceae bacterium]
MDERNTRIDDWLSAARADMSKRAPDQLDEQQLLARFREVKALQSIAELRTEPRMPRKVPIWRRWSFRLPVALAAAIVLSVGFLMLAPDTPGGNAAVRTPFFALVAPEAMAAERSAVIVPSQVSGAALAEYG